MIDNEYCLLECESVRFKNSESIFRRNVLPTSSGLNFDREDGYSKFLRNIGELLLYYVASRPEDGRPLLHSHCCENLTSSNVNTNGLCLTGNFITL
jgi:hypothetical protein